jgi:hypothetical protein
MTKTLAYEVNKRTTCRICGGSELALYLDLGDQPTSNGFISPSDVTGEQSFPLQVYLCKDCGLSQLIHVVSASDIFDDYAYLSSTSTALRNHYQGMVDSVLSQHETDENELVIDIGCNDGILLNRYPKDRYRLLGIEPSSAGKYAKDSGLEVITEFFDENLGKVIQQSHGGAKIITATNVFAHVDNIHSFAFGIKELLAEDGVFVLEFPYLDDMLEHGYFDTIYHEHLCYLALTPLMHLFQQTGLRAFNAERTDVGASGPALRLFVCLENARFKSEKVIQNLLDEETTWGVKHLERYKKFAATANNVKQQILKLIGELNKTGHKIGAFGAPAKGNTLLNFLGLSPSDIIAVAENNELKIGKLTPGSHIPIIGDEKFMGSGISHALLLSWNYAEFFLKNSKFVLNGGKFIIPLPDLCIRP